MSHVQTSNHLAPVFTFTDAKTGDQWKLDFRDHGYKRDSRVNVSYVSATRAFDNYQDTVSEKTALIVIGQLRKLGYQESVTNDNEIRSQQMNGS